MRLKVFRGDKLSSAIKLLENQNPKKNIYWITDYNEAKSYAEVNKWNDKSNKGAILEANINFNDYYKINPDERKNFENKNITKGKIGIYDANDFKIIITSPYSKNNIKNLKLINII